MTPDPTAWTPQSNAIAWTDDGELIVVPLAEWDAPRLSDAEVEEIAQAHLNDESGCRAGPCPSENGQGWCDAAMLCVSLRDARADLAASRAREAALAACVAHIGGCETCCTQGVCWDGLQLYRAARAAAPAPAPSD